MAKLNLGGIVQYIDLSPAAGANVEIWELDLLPGGTNDKILVRRTSADGKFSGISKDWDNAEGYVAGFPIPDVKLLEFRVSVDGNTHKGVFFTTGPGRSLPIILPFGPPKPVSRGERDLVQIIFLSGGMTGAERAMYDFIETSSEAIVAAALGPLYRQIHVVRGTNATLASFKSTLQAAAQTSAVDAVDVMFNIHGAKGGMGFVDGLLNTTVVEAALSTIPDSARAKFRAVFSTACHGKDHLSMWRKVGFSVAAGSRAVYADSATSFAPMVGRWATEGSFLDAITLANTMGGPADEVSRQFYLAQGQPSKAAAIDSTRSISGNGAIRIYSVP